MRNQEAQKRRRYSRTLTVVVGLVCATFAGCSANQLRDDAAAVDTTSFGSIALFDKSAAPTALPDKASVGRAGASLQDEGKEHNVLVLSGGGSHGAFGAGFMNGWSESGKRPEFDIITGVSTGALMATFVYLGNTWNEKLRDFYTNISDDQIYVTQGIAGILGESLHDTAPLKNLIDKTVNQRTLDAVAAEHRKGRRLYVATTNLDSGLVAVWDMGGIASSDHKDRLQLYRQILLASAAVPGLFKPVYIKTEDGRASMHVDGGIKAPILLRTFMVGNPKKKRTVYVLVNGSLTLRAGAPAVGPNFKDIALRSISELSRGLFYKTVYQSYVVTKHAGGDFRIAYVNDDVPLGDPFKFVAKDMRRLYSLGHAMGGAGNGWKAEPPRLEQLERVTSTQKPL